MGASKDWQRGMIWKDTYSHWDGSLCPNFFIWTSRFFQEHGLQPNYDLLSLTGSQRIFHIFASVSTFQFHGQLVRLFLSTVNTRHGAIIRCRRMPGATIHREELMSSQYLMAHIACFYIVSQNVILLKGELCYSIHVESRKSKVSTELYSQQTFLFHFTYFILFYFIIFLLFCALKRKMLNKHDAISVQIAL